MLAISFLFFFLFFCSFVRFSRRCSFVRFSSRRCSSVHVPSTHSQRFLRVPTLNLAFPTCFYQPNPPLLLVVLCLLYPVLSYSRSFLVLLLFCLFFFFFSCFFFLLFFFVSLWSLLFVFFLFLPFFCPSFTLFFFKVHYYTAQYRAPLYRRPPPLLLKYLTSHASSTGLGLKSIIDSSFLLLVVAVLFFLRVSTSQILLIVIVQFTLGLLQ